ncbi:hypothetical protein ABIA33_000485 [Streptacidiphilus sp. MAP12-16]|uniref:hypothetical protein n=1 Tax=Streptacidiphilus sp. MAP12-16 TaxID=3156300 RepID=UPI0035144CA7
MLTKEGTAVHGTAPESASVRWSGLADSAQTALPSRLRVVPWPATNSIVMVPTSSASEVVTVGLGDRDQGTGQVVPQGPAPVLDHGRHGPGHAALVLQGLFAGGGAADQAAGVGVQGTEVLREYACGVWPTGWT